MRRSPTRGHASRPSASASPADAAPVVTSDALTELKLRRGDDALAIIKSTEVMIAREAVPAAAPRRRPRSRAKR